jgi:hypothetical protein
MNVQINKLVKSLLQKDTLDECSVQELQLYADRHPYFGAAQLLLTKKLQSVNSEKYDEQLQKTFLYFHNPLWVEHLLNDNGYAEIIPGKTSETVSNNTEQNKFEEKVSTTFIEEKIKEPETVFTATETEPGENLHQQTEESIIPSPAEKKEEIKSAAADLIFEPYYTVDYFASQGIKAKEEDIPSDKFGKQLKSFTEWLKTMKRLPVSEIVRSAEPVLEQKVDQMAAHSLEEREVLTEAMAEVWEKQGNIQKALEIYTKLSLLEPSKSAYFASKIESLKKEI